MTGSVNVSPFAVIGSVNASLCQSGLNTPTLIVTPGVRHAAQESIGGAIAIAHQLGSGGTELLDTGRQSYFDEFQTGCVVAVLFAGAIFAAIFLRARPLAASPLER